MASHSSAYSANGRREHNSEVNLESNGETYKKVHHDLDVAAANRKPIVTESNYKVKVAEPGVEDLHLGDHEGGHHVEKKSSEKKTTVSKSTTQQQQQQQQQHTPSSGVANQQQKGQFIAKPDVYSNKGKGASTKEDKREQHHDDDDDDNEGGFPWLPVLGGAAAIAGAIAGLVFLKKRNPDVDQRFKRSVEDADHRVKGAIGSGERRFKELIGSGQQRFKNLVGHGHHDDSDDEGHNSHSHGRNPFNASDDGDLYKVKQGDNMSKIARKAGKKSWHEIAEENPSIRNPDLIYPGDRLRV